MRCICSYCDILFDVKEPLENDAETHGICSECHPIVLGNLKREIERINAKEEMMEN